MSRQTLSLNGPDWQFAQVPQQPFHAEQINDPALVTEWLPATVPGNVRTDLWALQRIPDPFFAEDYKQSLWVEGVDWWYRRTLSLTPDGSPLAPHQRAFLIFEGIDYLSAIVVNGQEKVRHEGMFSRQIIEITSELQQGPLEVAVRVWGSEALPRRKLMLWQRLWQRLVGPIQGGWVGVYPDRSATLKCQMSFGWDFAPPLRTMGIWDDVSLVITGQVFIREMQVRGLPSSISSQHREENSQTSEAAQTLPHPNPPRHQEGSISPPPLWGGLRGGDSPQHAPAILTLDLTAQTLPHPNPPRHQGGSISPPPLWGRLRGGDSPQHAPAILTLDLTAQTLPHPNPPRHQGGSISPPPLWGGLRGGDSPQHAPAILTLDLTLDTLSPRPVTAQIQLKPANFSGPTLTLEPTEIQLTAGTHPHTLIFDLTEVALWQPWDRGQPCLYDLELHLLADDGEPLDTLTIRTGFRTVDLQNWHFKINGQPEFIRGLNWVPADSFPGRLRREDYERLLTQMRQSGANMVRVWGGGLREKRAFYDLCDELGLLVWQEFPFACMFLGSFPRDPDFYALVEAECTAMVRQTNPHPSIIAWCGGNEFSSWRNQTLLKLLGQIGQRNAPDLPFIPVSPSHHHGHDSHNWNVWHGNAPLSAYQAETAHFLSEFGLQALPHLDTLQAVLPDPTSTTTWPTRHGDPAKLHRYASIFAPQTPSLNLQSLITTSQRAQALGLQTAIEHMRRRKGKSGGGCVWQFNEPWPAISWAIVEYGGRPKLAYEGLLDWYSPILISLHFPLGQQWRVGDHFAAEIWGINDLRQPLEGGQLSIYLDNILIHHQTVNLAADSSQVIGSVSTTLCQEPQQIKLTLQQNGRLIAQNSYPLAWQDTIRGSLYQQFRRWVADWIMR